MSLISERTLINMTITVTVLHVIIFIVFIGIYDSYKFNFHSFRIYEYEEKSLDLLVTINNDIIDNDDYDNHLICYNVISSLNECSSNIILASDHLNDLRLNAVSTSDNNILQTIQALKIGGVHLKLSGEFLGSGYSYLDDLNWEGFIDNSLLPFSDNLNKFGDNVNILRDDVRKATKSINKACEVGGCINMARSSCDDILEASKYLNSIGVFLINLSNIYENNNINGNIVKDISNCGYHITLSGKALAKFSFHLNNGRVK